MNSLYWMRHVVGPILGSVENILKEL
jgi:hypothetical protein